MTPTARRLFSNGLRELSGFCRRPNQVFRRTCGSTQQSSLRHHTAKTGSTAQVGPSGVWRTKIFSFSGTLYILSSTFLGKTQGSYLKELLKPSLLIFFRNFRTLLVKSCIFAEFRTVVRTVGLRRQLCGCLTPFPPSFPAPFLPFPHFPTFSYIFTHFPFFYPFLPFPFFLPFPYFHFFHTFSIFLPFSTHFSTPFHRPPNSCL